MTQAVCAVEVGWRGMRECSIALARTGAAVEVLIKGEVAPEVLAMITPKPGITIHAVTARRFAWSLALRLVGAGPAGEHLLIVNKPKTQRRAAWLGRLRAWRVLRLEETQDGYRVYDVRGAEVPIPELAEPGPAAAAPVVQVT